jgi:hypothetical protein
VAQPAPRSDADRRRIRLLRWLYRIACPGLVINPLVDALLGPKARARDPELCRALRHVRRDRLA